jgi:hypothetical protein
LEAKGVFSKDVVEEIRKNVSGFYFNSFFDNDVDVNMVYGDLLLKYFNNEIKNNIKLKKVRYH